MRAFAVLAMLPWQSCGWPTSASVCTIACAGAAADTVPVRQLSMAIAYNSASLDPSQVRAGISIVVLMWFGKGVLVWFWFWVRFRLLF